MPCMSRTLIDRIIESMHECGIQDISIGVGWKGDEIKKHLETSNPDRAVRCIDVPDYRIGALQTLVTTTTGLDEPVLICPVDFVFEISVLNQVLNSSDSLNSFDLSIATDDRKGDTRGTPMNAGGDNRIHQIGNGPLRSAMLLLAPPSFLDLCRTKLASGSTTVRNVLEDMVTSDMNVVSCPINGYWSDVDSLSDLLRVNIDLLQNHQPTPQQLYLPPKDELEIGESLTLPSGIQLEAGSHLRGPLLFDGAISIHEGSVIGPNVCIYGRSSIQRDTSITESVIFGNSTIEVGSYMSQMIVHDSVKYAV